MFFRGGIRDRYYAIVNRIFATSLEKGWTSLLTTAGLGALRPNVVLMKLPEWKLTGSPKHAVTETKTCTTGDSVALDLQFHSSIQKAMKMRFSTMVVRFPPDKGMDYDRHISTEELGFIDVWHVSDTGGFTLLVPNLLARSKYWRKRLGLVKNGEQQYHKRVFACCEALNEVAKIQNYHEDLIFQKRLDYRVHVEALCMDDATRSTYTYPEGTPFVNDPCMPSPAIIHEFNDICSIKLEHFIAQQSEEHQKQFYRWLRIGELMRGKSKEASMVCVTLPYARSWITPDVYVALLRILSNVSAPCFMLRGNGRSVLSAE